MSGMIHCQVLMGMLDDAEQQLEFFKEIQSTIGKSAVSIDTVVNSLNPTIKN